MTEQVNKEESLRIFHPEKINNLKKEAFLKTKGAIARKLMKAQIEVVHVELFKGVEECCNLK